MRRYCSRCLQTIGALDPSRCASPHCGAARPARGWPSFLPIGEVVDQRFEVKEILGAGGAGITYRCHDAYDGIDVALKILHDDRRHGVLANRLAIEGELLELLDHPHIVPFHGLRIVGDGPVWIATGFMPGGSLEGRLRRGGPLRADTVRRLGRQLALALDFIHAQGIVHRDLKPGNVLIENAREDELQVRLADFGIARVYRDQRPVVGGYNLTRTGMFIGTPEYAAPEQIRGERGVGPAADAYALGALLHFCASQQALLQRSEIEDWAAFRDRRRDPAARPRLLDVVEPGLVVGYREELAELDEIIDALMHPDADARTRLADVALRLGAKPSELTPRDVAPLAPRSLVSALDDPWFGDEEVDALVPNLASTPGLSSLPSLSGLDSLGPSTQEPTIVRGPRGEVPAPRSVPRPAMLAPGVEVEDVPDLDAVPPPDPDWESHVDWPTPSRKRRNRLHAAVLMAACVVAGITLAWPGGPAELVGMERLAQVGDPIGPWLRSLTTSPPRYEPSAPWEGKRIIVGEPSLVEPAPRAPQTRTVEAPTVEPKPKVEAKPAKARPKPERIAAQPSPPPPRAPRAQAPPEFAPLPKRVASSPALAAPTAVDSWSGDPDDGREVVEVVDDEVGRAQVEWLQRLTAEADAFDARAADYQRSAEVDSARRAALVRAWDRQLQEAKSFLGIGEDETPPPPAEPRRIQRHSTDRYDEIEQRWVHTPACALEEGEVASAH